MLAVSQISFERNFQPVFAPVDFRLAPGDVLLVTGPNGSGKTTLIRLLAGILTPSAGHIATTSLHTAFIGHSLGIKDDLTVLENVRFMARILGSSEQPVNDVIVRFGLREVAQQLVRSLSAGQRKRCALTRLSFRPAGLWLLDEPYSNLDEAGVELVDEMLHAHQAGGGLCVLATHGSHRPALMNLHELRLQHARGRDD